MPQYEGPEITVPGEALTILRQELAWDLGQLDRAYGDEELLGEARAIAVRPGSRLDLLRVRWVEGFLAERLGRRGDAVVALQEAARECRG
jgi:hypothetical protein